MFSLRGVCQSFCPMSALWLLVHCSSLLRRSQYASYWNAFLFLGFLGSGLVHPAGITLTSDWFIHPAGITLTSDWFIPPVGRALTSQWFIHPAGRTLTSDWSIHPAGRALTSDGFIHPAGRTLTSDWFIHPAGRTLTSDYSINSFIMVFYETVKSAFSVQSTTNNIFRCKTYRYQTYCGSVRSESSSRVKLCKNSTLITD